MIGPGRIRRGLIAAVLAAGLGGTLATGAAAADCTVPDELMQVDATLPHLRQRLAAHAPVTIVAIGGGSTSGVAAGSPDLAYPNRMRQVLAEWYPDAAITVVNKSVPRESAQQMRDRFASDVLAADPVLVIWETGITDAVSGTQLDDFAGALEGGIGELKSHDIDVVLVDMQYSRRTSTIIDFERYLSTLHRVGEVADVYVFPRFEMMRYWSEQNVFNFDDVVKSERAKLATGVYECIGRKLAEALRIAVR